MLRAYQSPYSAADCGPQCAHMPNLASRYHAGTCHSLSDSRVPLKGPGVIAGKSAAARASLRAGGTPASKPIACLLLSIIIHLDFQSSSALLSHSGAKSSHYRGAAISNSSTQLHPLLPHKAEMLRTPGAAENAAAISARC